MMRIFLIQLVCVLVLLSTNVSVAGQPEIVMRELFGDWEVLEANVKNNQKIFVAWTEATNDPSWRLGFGRIPPDQDKIEIEITIKFERRRDEYARTSPQSVYFKVDNYKWMEVPCKVKTVPISGLERITIELNDFGGALVPKLQSGEILKIGKSPNERYAKSFSLKGFSSTWDWLSDKMWLRLE